MAGLLNFWQEFDLDELLTHEVTLQDIEKTFELLKQPDCVKVLIKIWLIKLMLIKPGNLKTASEIELPGLENMLPVLFIALWGGSRSLARCKPEYWISMDLIVSSFATSQEQF